MVSVSEICGLKFEFAISMGGGGKGTIVKSGREIECVPLRV